MMWLADHSLRVLALVIIVGTGSGLAWRASARSRLFAWTVVLYVAAAMPLLAAILPDVPLPPGFSDPAVVISGDRTTSMDSLQTALTPEPVSSASSGQSLFPWLLAMYLAGATFLGARVLAGTYVTARVVSRAQVIDDPVLQADVERLSNLLKLQRTPRVLSHESVHVPFVCGMLRPALLLPDSWVSWDAETRHAVLAHELSHIARRDLWTMRVAAAYRAITWMNPISWWLRRRLETLADRASDEAVIASGVEPTAYAELLVRFFRDAQRVPGRANWQLAMARRGDLEAGKRVARVLSAREGGNVRLGNLVRVLVGSAVVLTAVPAMVLSASQPATVKIAPPPVALDTVLPAPNVVVPAQSNTPQVQERARTQVKPIKLEPFVVFDLRSQPVQDPEPEPWRSTRQATAEDTVAPQATLRFDPKYTADALRAKIQGRVNVEIIVSAEGNVTDARIVKSLDQVFGLDDEAIKTARQWKFIPGTYQGRAVALRAMLDFDFRVH